jgi:hypothetical protein
MVVTKHHRLATTRRLACDGTAWQLLDHRLTAELERREPGTTVKLTVERSDNKHTFTLTLAPPR